MNAIVNVNRSWGIGKDNELLCHIKEDMEFFKQKTLGKIIIYGNNTLKSFPNKAPLANRLNIVISRNENNILQESKDRSLFCRDIRIASENSEKSPKYIFKFYNLYKEYVSKRFGRPILLYANSIKKAVEYARALAYDDDIFICGGESIYEQFMPYIDNAYVTKNNYKKEADSFFPNLDRDSEWMISDQKAIMTESGEILEFWHYIKTNKFIEDNEKLTGKVKNY